MNVKFDFYEGEKVTFVWRFVISNDTLTFKHGEVSEIENEGIWIAFDYDEDESFIPYVDMHCFYRDGSENLEGALAGELGKLEDLLLGRFKM